jgi:hypothetical protein
MCYFHPPPSELPRLFWQLSLVYPFGAWRISLINPLLCISAGESHLMVCFPPMGGARCQSRSILHVEPTRPAYVPICVSFCQVRLERVTRAPVGGTNATGGPLTNGGMPLNPPRICCANAPHPRPPPRLPVQPLPSPPCWRPPPPQPVLYMPCVAPAKDCCPMFWIGGI